MADLNEQLNQVQWQDAPSLPAPEPKKQIPTWLLPVLGGSAFVVLVTIVVVVVVGLVNRGSPMDDVMQDLAAAEFDCQSARDTEKCMSNAPARLAKNSGDPTYCDDVSDDAKDSCISGAAKTAQDSKLCRGIKDDARRVACEEAIFAITMDEQTAYKDCATFTNPQLIRDCEHEWIRERILAGDCQDEAITESLCQVGVQYRAAIDARNPDLCLQITDADFARECEEFVFPGDRDFDGLNEIEENEFATSDTDTDSDDDGLADAQEVHQYGTDPAQADTDGDGFDDGTELKNGFDPLS